MFFKKAKGDRNYQKSNRYTAVAFDLDLEVKELVAQLMQAKTAVKRQKLSEQLCDMLCDLAKIDICTVKVSDTNQYHKRAGGRVVMKQYGYYKPAQKYIYIQNRTAVRGQILAPKTFLNTVLHEWMHHYDHCALGLNSVHTSGFYQRLGNLQRGLLGKDSGVACVISVRYDTPITSGGSYVAFLLMTMLASACTPTDRAVGDVSGVSQEKVFFMSDAGVSADEVVLHDSDAVESSALETTETTQRIQVNALKQSFCWHVGLEEDKIEEVLAIAEYPDGGYVAASTRLLQTPYGDHLDTVATRLGDDGYVQWSYLYGWIEDDVITDVVIQQDGNSYFVGYTYSTGAGEDDGWIMYLDQGGELIWEEDYGTEGSEQFTRAVLTEDQGLILVGTQVQEDKAKPWINRTDAEGLVMWSNVVQLENPLTPTDTALSNGMLVVVGTALGDFSQFNGFSVQSPYTVVFAVDPQDGKLQWLQPHYAVPYQQANAVLVHEDGNLSVLGHNKPVLPGASVPFLLRLGEAGEFNAQMSIPADAAQLVNNAVSDGADEYLLAGSHDGQFWFSRLHRSGTLDWQRQHQPGQANQILRSIYDNGVVIAGSGGIYHLNPDGTPCDD